MPTLFTVKLWKKYWKRRDKYHCHSMKKITIKSMSNHAPSVTLIHIYKGDFIFGGG